MRVTWIGQAGLLFKTDRLLIMIDPYLSNSVEMIMPKNYRRIEINEKFFDCKPDIVIFTHAHADHFDPETIKHFINEKSRVTVLAPQSVYEKVRCFGGDNNYVLFNRHTEWSEENIKFTAVKAEHSDPSSIGVIIEAECKKIYVTGDTLYNEDIFRDLPEYIYALFLPINGVGNNMNMTDAARFAERVAPKVTIPIHIGMFDKLSADGFNCPTKRILKVYEETEL